MEVPIQTGLRASIYFGSRPPHGFLESRAAPFIALTGDQEEMSYTELHRDPQKYPTKHKFFTDVLVLFDVETDEELKKRFLEKDPGAMNQVMARVLARSADLHRAADIASGHLWLRIHRQFVFELQCEHYLAFLSDADYAYNVTSPCTEMLQPIRLLPSGIAGIKETLPQTANLDLGTQDWVSRLFRWLMSAWSQRDPVHQFVELFIVFEVLLAHSGGDTHATSRRFWTRAWRWLARAAPSPRSPESVANLSKIRDLIKKHGGGDRALLLRQFQSLLEAGRRPPLSDRFATLAQDLSLNGWEQDVVAFKSLLKKRNKLLHHGEREIALSYMPSGGEIILLRDLAARYVNARVFGDDLKTRWRHDAPPN